MKPCRHPLCPDTGPCRKAKPPAPRKRIKKVSAKQARDNRKYSKERKAFLSEGDLCEAMLEGCTGVATDLHHPAGRVGKNLLEVKKCKRVCRSCHDKIHNDPLTAMELGLSESRLKINQ